MINECPTCDAVDSRPGIDRDEVCHKENVARRFGRRAATYDSVTPVQQQMGMDLLALVDAYPQSPTIRRVLELGCGRGSLTRTLRQRYPEATITAVDLSADMIAHARRSGVHADWVCADAESFGQQGHQAYDLIISNSAVQWFSAPTDTLAACRARLTAQGILAWSTFTDGTFAELKTAFRVAYEELELAPQTHWLPLRAVGDWKQLVARGEPMQRCYTLAYDGVSDFLQAVKAAGASFTGRSPSVLRPDVYRRMQAIYREQFPAASGQGIRVTYEGFLVAESACKPIART